LINKQKIKKQVYLFSQKLKTYPSHSLIFLFF